MGKYRNCDPQIIICISNRDLYLCLCLNADISILNRDISILNADISS